MEETQSAKDIAEGVQMFLFLVGVAIVIFACGVSSQIVTLAHRGRDY